MKILIELGTFTKKHDGGKDEVAYNLLRGFSALGLTKNIICVCNEDLVDIIKGIDKDYEIIICNRKNYSFLHKIRNDIRDFCKDRVKQLKQNHMETSKNSEVKYENEKEETSVKNDLQNKTKNQKNYSKLMLVIKTEWKIVGLEYADWLNTIVRDNNIDLVLYTNKSYYVEKLCVPTVAIAHDVKNLYFDKTDINPTAIAICKKTLKNANHVVAISEFDRGVMIDKMPKYKNKYKLIYDPIFFRSIEHKEDRFITVLNIRITHKNPKTVIEAYGKIAKYTDLELVLIGNLPDNIDELKKCVSDLNIENRVHFTGFLPQEKVDEIISKTRIFINPSLFEGFGMPAVEMMGNGIPVIVADNTSQKEVTLGEARYYAPATDSEALADVIMDEIRNPKSKEELKDISGKVKELYSYKKIAADYWQFMEECVNIRNAKR